MIVPIPSAAPEPSASIEDSPYLRLLEGSRETGERLDYVSADKRFSAGVASYESCTLEINDWPIDEVMVVLEGSIAVSDSAGSRQVFGPGEAFVMPRGFCGTWQTLGHTRKIAVSYAAR